MSHTPLRGLTRRRLLAAATAGLAATALGPIRAAWALLPPTPQQTAGPFYTRFKPLSVDSDLVLAPGRTTPARGRVIHVMGRVLDPAGRLIAGARVEIWQANADGRYAHPDLADGVLRSDTDFQGVGHDAADDAGAYRFRTIKPGAYGSLFWRRTPHIHFGVAAPGAGWWTTQMYFAGEESNESDGLLNALDPALRPLVVMPERAPTADMEPGSGRFVFDIVLGSPATARKPA